MNARAAIEKSDAALRFKLVQQNLPALECRTGDAIDPLSLFEQLTISSRDARGDRCVEIDMKSLEERLEVAPMLGEERGRIEG